MLKFKHLRILASVTLVAYNKSLQRRNQEGWLR